MTKAPCKAPLFNGRDSMAGVECVSWYASTQACGPARLSAETKNMMSFDQRDHLLKYRARVKTKATPLRFSFPSIFFQAPISTMASVASPLGACSMAYIFSPVYVSPADLYSNFCLATFSPEALNNSSNLSLTLITTISQYVRQSWKYVPYSILLDPSNASTSCLYPRKTFWSLPAK